MNKKLLTLSILSVLGVSALAGSLTSKKVSAEWKDETVLPFLTNTYEDDFARFPDGNLTKQEVNADEVLFVGDHAKAKAETISGIKQLDLFVDEDDGAGYSRMFGIGHQGLKKLVEGNSYRFTAYVDMSHVASGSELSIEYTRNLCWTGVVLKDGNITPCLPEFVSSLSYKDNVVSFVFTAGDVDTADHEIRPYIKFTLKNANLDDYLVIRNYKLEECPTYTWDFEDIDVGKKSNPEGITNIYTNGLVAEVKENNTLGHYLEVSGSFKGETYPQFYFNRLTGITSGHIYRFSFDISDYNFNEMYVKYNDSWGEGNGTYTYLPNGTIAAWSNPSVYLGQTSWDGHHLELDVRFDNKVNGSTQFWNQIDIQFGIKEECEFKANIDNVKFVDLTTNGIKTLGIRNGKTSFGVGEAFSAGDLEVYFEKDETVYPLDYSQYIVDSTLFNNAEKGLYTITVKTIEQAFGKSLSATYDVEVVDVPVSISMNSLPNKSEYKYGEDLDLTGAKLAIEMSSGETTYTDVTSAMISGYNSHTVGSQTVTVSYLGKTTSFDVTVADYITAIQLTTPSNVLTFTYGEQFAVSGASLTVTYASGSTQNVAVTSEMCSGFNSSVIGSQPITITYEGLTAFYYVNVVDQLVSISLSSFPNTEVSFGANLNLTGAFITVTKTSGASEQVAVSNEMISGFNNKTIGEQVITITYEGLTTTVAVNVIDKITGISLKEGTLQTSYEVGDSINLEGAQLVISYASGNEDFVPLTKDMISNFSTSSVGDFNLTIIYKGFLIKVNYSVTAKQEEGSSESSPAVSSEGTPIASSSEQGSGSTSKGCGGSIVAGSSILFVSALALLISLKKKED